MTSETHIRLNEKIEKLSRWLSRLGHSFKKTSDPKRNKTAVCFVCHEINDEYIKRYKKLAEEKLINDDLYWVFCSSNTEPSINDDINLYIIDKDQLGRYNVMTTYWQHESSAYHFECSLIFRNFYETCPNKYDYYWFIEYDAVCYGSWKSLFQTFDRSDSDFLASHMVKGLSNFWAKDTITKTNIPINDRIRSFNPVCRLSSKAIDLLSNFQNNNCFGFFEVFIPTMLHYSGLKIEDIGGDGMFTKTENINKFYIPLNGENLGSMGWNEDIAKQYVDMSKRNNIILHPIK